MITSPNFTKKNNLLWQLSLGLGYFILMSIAQAAPIVVDGNLSDWSPTDRLEQSPVTGYELYGRYENNSYKVAIHSATNTISEHTSIWLDTDKNASTGYLIWGFAVGAEYKINIFSDGKPYLYTGSNGDTFVAGPLNHSIISDGGSGTNMEIDIPESLINTPQEEVHLFIDINDTDFLPASYSPASNGYVISKTFTGDNIVLDGNLSDWKAKDRLEETNTSVAGYELYGRYENNSYKLALHNLNGTISALTTFWLNTDQDSNTGYKIWGSFGGAEYNINIRPLDGKPYLYTGADGQTLVSVNPLPYSIASDNNNGEILEISIPETLINTPSGDGINILADVNNSAFLPSSYANHYTLLKNPAANQGKIVIDGSKSDWTEEDRLDLSANNAVNGAELYGRYEDGKYKILLHDFSRDITQNTTIWLNTDQDTNTGYKIWGFAGGAEYNININASGVPFLYTNNAGQTYVAGPLNYAKTSVASGSILELEIPEGLIGTPNAEGINLLLDINNSAFMPLSYSPDNQYILLKRAIAASVGIVYSETTANNFFNKKAYAQLFMSVQSQAMMAGLPFDLLSENDLLDINKIKKYKTLVFPSFANVNTSSLAQIEQNLTIAINEYKVGIVTAGNFLTNDETGNSLPGDAYARMKSLMGVTRTSGSNGGVDSTYEISNINHPITSGEYSNNEIIKSYNGVSTDYFVPTGAYNTAVIATQTIEGNTVKNALITIDHGGRHAHFATAAHMVDVNLLWSTLQWSVYGNKAPASLQMSRNKAIFVSRNDMDQSMFSDEVANVDGNLLTVLQTWKNDFDFVGSYYINVGNNPTNQEETNWAYSGPLYQQYMVIGNEIGTHSYTHPHDTNILSDAQISFEFADSRSVIEQELGLSNIGGAVPGAPEGLAASLEIIKHVDYLSGGYSSVGAGYPNAFGFLTPTSSKVYLSPNMSFDFTLIGFQHHSAAEAKQIWFNEFDALVAHNNQAFIHWPWHDYGPNDTDNAGYTLDMFTSLISKAHQFGSEFMTGKDFTNRIKSFKTTGTTIFRQGDTITANVKTNNSANFALKLSAGNTIKSVDNWYAYDNNQVFLDKDGGKYTINLGTASSITHITALPSRSQLISLTGDGTDLQFQLKGTGKVNIDLKCSPSNINISGGVNTYTSVSSSKISLNFSDDKLHAITNVDISCP